MATRPDPTVTDFGGGRVDSGPRPGPRLYRVLRCEGLSDEPEAFVLDGFGVVEVGRGERKTWRSGSTLSLAVEDSFMSTQHARLRPGVGGWAVEDAGSKNGTLVNGQRAERQVLADGDVVEMGHTFFLYRERVEPSPEGAPLLPTLVPALARQLAAVAQVAESAVSIMLRGEQGTGKEVVARALHERSDRSGAFVAVNCGALPDALIETELFGYRKGAFSGANEDRVGLVRAADRGTLLLDEIGDLPLASQTAFLRVLQEREVMPVGATRAVPVDVRVVAATNRDLPALVDSGEFRGDLYTRLVGLTVELPPLRARSEDLGALVKGLLVRLGAEPRRVTMTPRAARALFRYRWPGNVRELEKLLGAALALAAGKPLDVEHFPDLGQAPRETPTPVTTEPPVDEEHARILDALARANGNQTRAAELLGVSRRTLVTKLEKYGVPRPRKS